MNELYTNINEKNIEKLKKLLRGNTITYRKDVNVLSNFNQDEFIAIIENGSVDLEYNDYSGNRVLLETIKQGELFSSISQALYKEEVICKTKEETQITFFEYNQIVQDEIIKADFYITFMKNLIKILREQLNNKNERIEVLTQKTTRDKLLEYFRLQSKGNKTFTIPFTYTDLADYLSVDRSAMTREIKYLKEEGFIKTNGKKITLLF